MPRTVGKSFVPKSKNLYVKTCKLSFLSLLYLYELLSKAQYIVYNVGKRRGKLEEKRVRKVHKAWSFSIGIVAENELETNH